MPAPIVTATLQATAIASASNVVAQYIEQRDQNVRRKPPFLDTTSQHSNKVLQAPFAIDLPEFLRFVILSLLTAPPNFLWQMLLERTFPGKKAVPVAADEEKGSAEETEMKLDWKNTMIKWFVDCITMGALLNTTAFLVIMGLMKGRTLPEIGTALRTVSIVISLTEPPSFPFPCVYFWGL